MLESIFDNKILILLMEISLLCGLGFQIMIGIFLNKLVKETENMSTTNVKALKQFKLKYTNCLIMHEENPNGNIYTDKFISRLSIGKISITSLNHFSGQIVLFSIFLAGIGICKELILQSKMVRLLPFYFLSFLHLYFYFSITSLVDIKGKKEILKISLMDFLENHMIYKVQEVKESIHELNQKELDIDNLSTNENNSKELKSENKKNEIQQEWFELEKLLHELITE